jgi:hypothetical protein
LCNEAVILAENFVVCRNDGGYICHVGLCLKI